MPIYEIQQNGKTYEVDAPTPDALKKLLGQTLPQTNPTEYDPSSQEFQQKYGPTGSNLDNFRAGYGKSVTDIGRGISQLVGVGPSREEMDQIKQQDMPLMRTKAGIGGNILGGVVTTSPTMFIPGVNTYLGAAAVGGGLGALQPVGTQDSRLKNIGIGAAGGLVGKYVGDKISGWASKVQEPNFPEVTGLNQSAQSVAERGQAIGMGLTPGQASGSKALQQLEAKWESQPLTSGPFNALKEDNARVLGRSFLKAIGEKGDDVSESVLSHADQRIGNVFEKAAENNRIAYDDTLQSALAGIEGAASRELKDDGMKVISKQLQTVIDKASDTGSLSGQQFQNIRQGLNRLSGNQDTSVGYWARQIRDSLDDALERSVGDKASQELRQARSQYRILATALNRTGAINPSGGLRPGILANAISQGDPKGYLLGRNQSDLYNALRFSQAFRPIVGDSGTATRSQIGGISDAALRSMNGVLARLYMSPLAVSAATKVTPAAQAMSALARRGLGTAPYYAPYLLPAAGGVIAPQLLSQ